MAWLVGEINSRRPAWHLVGFLDDDEARHGTMLDGLAVLAGGESLPSLPDGTHVVCAVGDPQAKARVVERLRSRHFPFASLIHPSVHRSPSVQVGEGSVIMPGAALTVDIRLGDHVLVSPGCTVGHDTVVGHGASLMPGVHLAGRVNVGERVFLGMGAVVISGVTVGADVTVGAGAAVIRDLPPGVTAVGVPARVIRGG